MHHPALPVDARTGIHALGVINGRTIWPIAGGSEPAPEPTPEPAPTPESSTPAPEPAEDVTDWKAEARKWEQRAKENRQAKTRLDEIEAASQTELEKEQKAREAAEQRVTAATVRAVRGEVKALAAGTFADLEDAVLNLGDLTRFVGDDGEIDDKAIGDELGKVLERKPHLAKKTEPVDPPRPGAPARPTESLRPGAAPAAEPERSKDLFQAVERAFAPQT